MPFLFAWLRHNLCCLEHFDVSRIPETIKSSLLELGTGGNSILVEYVDLITDQQAQKEINSNKEENWRHSKSKDAGKF